MGCIYCNTLKDNHAQSSKRAFTILESFRVLERVVSPAYLDRISESLPLRKRAGV